MQAHEVLLLVAGVSSKNSDNPVGMCRFISTFTTCISLDVEEDTEQKLDLEPR